MKKIFFFLLILIFSFGIIHPLEAASASLYLSPSTGSFEVGSNFSVSVKVNSGGVAINAAEGEINFSPNYLQVLSISKTGTIFSLWTTEPTFSNSTGKISFGGGTPSNYSGSAGNIITVNFNVKSSATAQLSFSSGSVLAADGKGTNVLGSMSGATFTLKPKTVIPPSDEVPPESEFIPPGTEGGVPVGPIVSSVTHPDPNKWYSNNIPEFSWNLPSDITAIKLLFDKVPTSLPTVLYTPVISEKKLEEKTDGAWYFHIRFKNDYGWGSITHRKVLIDTAPPEPFQVRVDNSEDPTNPCPVLHFGTTDSLSGIENYEIIVFKEESIPTTNITEDAKPYRLKPKPPGEYMAIVKAVDFAGNSTIAITEFEIEALEAPVITDYPKTSRAGEVLEIKGTSLYPESKITVYIKEEGKEGTNSGSVKTESDGSWTFVYDERPDEGIYNIFAVITDNRGAESIPSEEITVYVAPPTFIRIGKIIIDYLAVIITLLVFAVVLTFVFIIFLRRIRKKRKKIKKELTEAERALYLAFKALKEETEEQVAKLDGKPGLSEEEKKISKNLKEALKISEKFIGKEVEDIERELK